MGDLAVDTAVHGTEGRYTARLSEDWAIWGPNGGYVASIALRAAGAQSRFDRPASLVGHFLGVAKFDTVDLEVTVLRAAKQAESLRVVMTQDGRPIFEALVWAVGDVRGLEHNTRELPDRRDPEAVPPTSERMAAAGIEPMFPFWSNFDERSHDWIEHWEDRVPGPPVIGRFYRYVPRSTFDDPWVDACRSVILLDTLGWPAVCQLHTRQQELIAPSIDLSIGFHRFRPSEPWLYTRAEAASASGGLVGCESQVWASDGTLLGVAASQLLCRPVARP